MKMDKMGSDMLSILSAARIADIKYIVLWCKMPPQNSTIRNIIDASVRISPRTDTIRVAVCILGLLLHENITSYDVLEFAQLFSTLDRITEECHNDAQFILDKWFDYSIRMSRKRKRFTPD